MYKKIISRASLNDNIKITDLIGHWPGQRGMNSENKGLSMLSLALIVGLWTTTCIQTQMGGAQGYVTETYSISKTGDYELTRDWYIDPLCTTSLSQDSEAGTIELGKRLGGIFVSGETYEANFSDAGGTDLGAVAINGNKSLKLARGMKNSTMRNTMVGVFEYFKK